MGIQALDLLFCSVRGLSVSQLLVLLGAMLARWQLWGPAGSKEVGSIVGKVLLPVFMFLEFAKPEARDKLKTVFTSAEGPLLLGLSAGLMLTYLFIGAFVVKFMQMMFANKGCERAGNIISISVAFGNASALPMLFLGTILHFFEKGDQVSLYLFTLVYATINKLLMYTAGSAICAGKMKLSVLWNEVNIGSALGLLFCFSEDLFGINLMTYLNSPNNWLDVAGTGKALALMANPLLQLVSGAALSKGPKSEDLDMSAISVSVILRLMICAPICYVALIVTGVTASHSSNMKVMGFVLMMQSCMPAASQLNLIAVDSGKPGALQNMSTLLFYQSILCPLTCTVVIAFALSQFSTATIA